jgi:hypothetical protein
VSSVAHVHLGGLTWWWRYLAIRWLCLTSLYGCQVLEREKRFDVARHYLECCHRATSRESAHQVFPLGGGGECDGCAAALEAWCHDATTKTRSRRPVSDVGGGGGVDVAQVPLVNEHNDNPMRHLHLAIALRLSRDHAHLGNKDVSIGWLRGWEGVGAITDSVQKCIQVGIDMLATHSPISASLHCVTLLPYYNLLVCIVDKLAVPGSCTGPTACAAPLAETIEATTRATTTATARA